MKRRFTAQEVEELFWEGEIEEGEDRRWSRYDTSVVKVDGVFYIIGADIGLTENQESYYEAQEVDEVELVREEQVIIGREWRIKK